MGARTIKFLCTLAALGAGGCFGSNAPNGNDDAAYGTLPDLGPLCSGNNDGVIARDELAFPVGMSVNYLSNPSGTTTTVAPERHAGRRRHAVGSDVDRRRRPPAHARAARRPSGSPPRSPARPTRRRPIWRPTRSASSASPDDGLYILGYASETPNQTLLVYDAPVLSLKFPVTLGDSWVSSAHIVNGTLNGMPYAGLDTYKISIDARGTAVLPFLSFDNTMRVHVDLTQTVPGGISVTRIQYLFFHECYGELGRMVSVINETNEMFTNAGRISSAGSLISRRRCTAAR